MTEETPPPAPWAVKDAVRRGLRKHLPPQAFAGRGFWADEEPGETPSGTILAGEVIRKEYADG